MTILKLRDDFFTELLSLALERDEEDTATITLDSEVDMPVIRQDGTVLQPFLPYSLTEHESQDLVHTKAHDMLMKVFTDESETSAFLGERIKFRVLPSTVETALAERWKYGLVIDEPLAELLKTTFLDTDFGEEMISIDPSISWTPPSIGASFSKFKNHESSALDEIFKNADELNDFLREKVHLSINRKWLDEEATDRWSRKREIQWLKKQKSDPPLTHIPDERVLEHPDFARYFDRKDSSSESRQNIQWQEFGLDEMKLDRRGIYVLMSADWTPREINDESARQASFRAISDYNPIRDIVRHLIEWLIVDSLEFPGTALLRFALVGTNPEQSSSLDSRRARLRMKINRADVFICHLPARTEFSRANIEFEIAAGMETPNIFVMSDSRQVSGLGLSEGFFVSQGDSSFSTERIRLAVKEAKALIGLTSDSIAKDLRLLRESGADGQLASWIALLYLHIRDLACSRNMIDESKLARRYAIDDRKISGKKWTHDPVLARLVESKGADRIRRPVYERKVPYGVSSLGLPWEDV